MRWIPLFLCCITTTATAAAYRFAVVPKRTNSPFFDAVREGCEARAFKYTDVECVYVGPEDSTNITQRQVEILTQLLPTIDGFAIAVKNETAIGALIQQASRMKKYAVTFDSDAANSSRVAYVGTDNYKFGRELAHVLLQLSPEGGQYGILAGSLPQSPNLKLRIDGVRDGLLRSGWTEVPNSPANGQGKPLVALAEMERLVQTNPDIRAIIPIGGWPMYEPEGWEAFADKHPQLVTIVADALEVQIQLMNRGAANGLVGQYPFEMGQLAIDALYQLKIAQEQGLPPPFPNGTKFATPVLNVLQIPQNLPPLQEDMNYIGNLAILGYVLCGIIVVTCAICAAWTFVNRKRFVVRASQPPFLYMICFGVLVMGSAIIPLSLDDEKISIHGCSIACQCVPWLLSIGFVTVFSALFSKTWRINQIHRNAQQFRRVRVTARDVIVPFAVLMTLNIIVLLCWTLIAPLQYERRPHSGTDNWNRVSRSYYGACFGASDVKGGATPYVVCLIVINFSCICIANVQAYQARKIKTHYAESKYIAFIMLTMFQSWLVGLPILALVRDDPQAYFVVLTILIFATCMATLLFLFIPKLTHQVERASSLTITRTARRTSSSILRPSVAPRSSAVQFSERAPRSEVVNEVPEEEEVAPVSAVEKAVDLSNESGPTPGSPIMTAASRDFAANGSVVVSEEENESPSSAPQDSVQDSD